MNDRQKQVHIVPSPTLWAIVWRYLLRHPWQSALMIIGITLGVAVAVAIDLANVSAIRAFELSTTAVTGRATHTISGGPLGIDEQLYVRLRQAGVTPSAPVIEEYVSSPQLSDIPLQLLGIDPFAEPPFRTYLFAQGTLPLDQLTDFFTEPATILL
jgi:putative ABC transport system permease protein